MFEWFDFDVLLAVVAALTQATTGILGWRVTVSGVPKDERRKLIYEVIFIGATACGIIAAGLAAHRSTSLIGELHAKMHVDRFVFFPRGSDPSLPDNNPRLIVGEELAGLAHSTNRGALPFQHLGVACEMTITPILAPTAEDRLFDQLLVDQKNRLNQVNKNEVLQGDNQDFGCITKDRLPITEEQYEDLLRGTTKDGTPLVVYVTIFMKYTDKLGKELATENCWHVYVGAPDKPLDCLNHNR
jgi:hypothetical protein